MIAKVAITRANPRKGPRARSQLLKTDLRVSPAIAGADVNAGVFIRGLPSLRSQLHSNQSPFASLFRRSIHSLGAPATKRRAPSQQCDRKHQRARGDKS